MLRDGEVDAAVIFRYDDGTPPDGIRTTHLLDDPMYLLSLEHGDTLRDHRDSPWIGGCEHCRREFVHTCEAAGFTRDPPDPPATAAFLTALQRAADRDP